MEPIFGYNGFGRLSGNETGSVGGQAGGGGQWGPTGLTRLFGAEMGTQISWLLPAALGLLAVGLVVTWRTGRRNRTRAALLLWGGWLVVTGLAFSLGRGIIHPYYTVALAPAIGAVVGIGGSILWSRRQHWAARAGMAAAVLVTAVWSDVLLDRTPDWLPWLRPVIIGAGAMAAVGLMLWPLVRGRFRMLIAAGSIVACLAGPLAYTLDTVNTAHSGAIPTAGPAGGSTGAGPGGRGGFAGAGRGTARGRGDPCRRGDRCRQGDRWRVRRRRRRSRCPSGNRDSRVGRLRTGGSKRRLPAGRRRWRGGRRTAECQ